MNYKKVTQLVKGYLLRNWKKTLLIVLIMIFTISGYLLVNVTFRNVQATNLNIAETSYGKWHFLCKYVSQNEIEQIKKKSFVSEIGCEWVIGTSDTGVLLLYRDEKYNEFDTTKFGLEKGAFPEKPDELAVTRSYADSEGIEIGDSVTLSYEKVDYFTGDSLFRDLHTFTITGIIENYELDDTMKICMVSEELKDAYADRIEIENMYGTFYDTGNIKGFARQLYLDCHLKSEIKLNDHIIFAEQDNTVYKLINYAVNVFIWIISALLLYNILYFMLMGQKKDLSILRSIGFDNSDLKKCIGWEVVILLLISIPMGILSGMILNAALFDKLTGLVIFAGNAGESVINSKIPYEVILISIAMVVLSVIPAVIIPLREFGKLTPVAFRNSREDTDISRKWLINAFLRFHGGKMYEYGIKSLARNKKKTTITVVTTFLSVMVISAILFMDSFEMDDGSWIKRWIPEDVRVTAERGKYVDTDIIDKLENIDGVESVQAYQLADVWFTVPIADMNADSKLYKGLDAETKKVNVFTDENNVERFMFNVTAIGCHDLSGYLGLDQEEEHCIVVSDDIAEFLIHNDNIAVLNLDEVDKSTDKYTNLQSVKIGQIIDKFQFMPEEGIGVTMILMDENTLFSLTGEKGYNRLDVKLDNSDDITPVMTMNELPEIQEVCDVSVYQDRVDAYLAQSREQMRIQMFLIIIFIFVAIINNFNTIINNMLHRVREFDLMRIIGFTRQEVFTSVLWENICYSMLAVMLSAGIQIILLLLNKIFHWGFSASVLRFVILDIVIVLLNFILIEYGFHWSQKMNAEMET